MRTRVGLMVVTGLLAILLGAMPLVGYFECMRAPSFFHHDAFVGSVWHLSAGVVPFGAGILLLALSRASTKQILLLPLYGVSAGIALSLPSIITGNDHRVLLAWLSVIAIGQATAVLVHLARQAWQNQTLNLGNGGRGQ